MNGECGEMLVTGGSMCLSIGKRSCQSYLSGADCGSWQANIAGESMRLSTDERGN